MIKRLRMASTGRSARLSIIRASGTVAAVVLAAALVGATSAGYVTDAAGGSDALEIDWLPPSLGPRNESPDRSMAPGRLADEVLILENGALKSLSLTTGATQAIQAPLGSGMIHSLRPGGKENSWFVSAHAPSSYRTEHFTLSFTAQGNPTWGNLGELAGSSSLYPFSQGAVDAPFQKGRRLDVPARAVRMEGSADWVTVARDVEQLGGVGNEWFIASNRFYHQEFPLDDGFKGTIYEVDATSVADGPTGMVFVAELREGIPFLTQWGNSGHGIRAVKLPLKPRSMAYSQRTGTVFMSDRDRIVEVDPSNGSVLAEVSGFRHAEFPYTTVWPEHPVFTTDSGRHIRWLPV